MDKRSICSIAIGAAILVFLLGAYICNFCHNGISDVNQDWAGFAGYMGLGTGLISVVLLYATFMEQRRTNSFEVFAKMFYFSCETIGRLEKECFPKIVEDANRISIQHNWGDDRVEYTLGACKAALSRAYSRITNDKNQDEQYLGLLSYIERAIKRLLNYENQYPANVDYVIDLLAMLNVTQRFC